MYYTRLDEQSVFMYLPELEPLFAAYGIMQGERVHKLCTELYGADSIVAWRAKYRFLFEIYQAIEPISMMGFFEQLLYYPLEEFSLDAFREQLISTPSVRFLYRYLDGRLDEALIEDAQRSDEGMEKAYLCVADRCASFLAFSSLMRQSRRYIDEFFAFVGELQTDALQERLSAESERVLLMRDSIGAEVKSLGAFECSQKQMGKQFYNRGSYSEFFFIPSLFLPMTAMRFFHVREDKKRQILFLTLRDVRHSEAETLRSLRALSDATRYKILTLLAQEKPMRGLDIAKRLSLAPSTVSHHMEQLKEGGLITEEVAKNSKYYGIARANVAALLKELEVNLTPPE